MHFHSDINLFLINVILLVGSVSPITLIAGVMKSNPLCLARGTTSTQRHGSLNLPPRITKSTHFNKDLLFGTFF